MDATVTVLVANEPDAHMLVVDENSVYWMRIPATNTNGQIVKASQVTGTPTVLASGQTEMFDGLPEQLAVDETNVYRSQFSAILAAPKDGSALPKQIAAGNGGPFLATDAAYLYWASMHSIHRQRKGTTTDELLAQSASIIWEPIAVTATGVFFWNGNGLYRVDKAGGAAVLLALPDPPTSKAFVSDETYVYWQRGNEIVRSSDAGEVSPVARISTVANALALDSDSIYWIGAGKIFRARK